MARHLTDISDLRETEVALRASEQRFRTFVDHAADAFFLHDDQGRIIDMNRAACDGLGYTREELVGMNPLDMYPDLTPANFDQILCDLKAEKTVEFESFYRRKDGTIFPVEIRSRAFWEGGRQFIVALARDITERKRAEERLRSIVNYVVDGIISITTAARSRPSIQQPKGYSATPRRRSSARTSRC